MSFKPPKGTDDIVFPESSSWRRLLMLWEEKAATFGYPLVITPLFESTDLFERGVGGDTDVVAKQMYNFTDKGGRMLTLRPEGTAGLVRAYLDSGVQGVWKASYSGPMFRYERPQAGRRRQFWQVGAECIGTDSPYADVELIELAHQFLVEAAVEGLELRLNALGDAQCRPAYQAALTQFLFERRDELCDDSVQLIESNPLRILDCKICGPKISDAPTIDSYLCRECSEHFEVVQQALDDLGIAFVRDSRLVRGLDYYTRTVFEFIGTTLDAAQNAVGGGGRYDGLAETIGGRSAPGVGFALGINRIILASEADSDPAVSVFIVSEAGVMPALMLASQMRDAGIKTGFEAANRSVKAQFRAASRSGAPFTVLIPSDGDGIELRKGQQRTRLSPADAIERIEAEELADT